MKSTSFLHRGIYAVLDSIILTIFNFIYVIAVVRSIPKEEYGALVLCDSIRIFLILFGDISVGQALIKYAAEKDESELPAVITHSVLLKLGLTCVSTVVLLLFADSIAGFFHVPKLAGLLRWVPALLFAVLLNYFMRQLLTAKQKLHSVCYIDIWLLLSFFIYFIIFKLNGILDTGIKFIWMLVLCYLTATIPGLWYARKLLTFQKSVSIEWFKKIARYSWFSFINSAGVQVYSKIDLFMLAYFASPLSVAIYNNARLFTNFSIVINESMNTIVFPETAKVDLSLGTTSRDRIRKIYETSSGILFLFAIPVTLILFIFPEFILQIIYGGKYQEAAPLVRVFAFWGLMHPLYRIAGSIFNGIGKPEVNARLTWIGAGINIIVNLALIPLLGALGAAITALVTTAAILVIYLVMLRKQFAVRPLAIDFVYLRHLLMRK